MVIFKEAVLGLLVLLFVAICVALACVTWLLRLGCDAPLEAQTHPRP